MYKVVFTHGLKSAKLQSSLLKLRELCHLGSEINVKIHIMREYRVFTTTAPV